jgi:uncharacterized membrane protein YdjX (TVP38/TMEM64 family)
VQDSVAGAGALGPLYFGAGYVAATVALLPASVLTLGAPCARTHTRIHPSQHIHARFSYPPFPIHIAAGFLFGPLKGTLVVSASSTLAAAISFLIARSSLRPRVESFLRSSGAFGKSFATFDALLGADGTLVFLLRLSPLFPFSLSNYLLGLTAVRFWPYVGATWAGALPGTFCYVYLGATAEAAAGGLPPLKLALYGAFAKGRSRAHAYAQ